MRSVGLILTCAMRNLHNVNFKGGGQECPPYTLVSNVSFLTASFSIKSSRIR